MAKRRVRQRGADAGGPDEHELEAREREAEDRTAAISELLVTRSDELLDAKAHAAKLRLPRPGPSRPGPSSDDLPSPSIVGMAGVPPRLLSETAVDISPSTGGFSTPIPSSLSPVDGQAPDLLSTPVGAPTGPPHPPPLGATRGTVSTPYPPALPGAPLPGVAGSTSGPPYPAALADAATIAAIKAAMEAEAAEDEYRRRMNADAARAVADGGGYDSDGYDLNTY